MTWLRVLDVDAVLTAHDGDVPERDMARANDDPAAHDAADKRLGMPDHERSLHGAVQVHRRRPHRVGGAEPGDERHADGRRHDHAAAPELAAGLAVLEPKPREDRLREDLRARARRPRTARVPASAAPRSRARASPRRRARARRAPSGSASHAGW